MKRSDYKPLGDYIALVNERNRDLAITHLVGVSIEKKFIPSIANIIGTDLSPYKIIRHNQFAYGPVTSRNGEKITIALYKDTEDGILSQAYEVFRIKDEEQLLPEYLMLWVQRPEFDRYARFKSHGSVREIFSWEEMCNVMLPIPPISEQRKIVEQYQTIERRIKNNEALIQKLEATAQALYHHTFVEGIDKENLPEGWSYVALTDIAHFLNGKPCQDFSSESGVYPVLKIGELSQGFIDSQSNWVGSNFPKNYLINKGDLVFSWSATLCVSYWNHKTAALNQHLFKVIPKKYPKWFCYMWIKNYINKWSNIISAKAVSMGHIKKEDLESAVIFVPDKELLEITGSKMTPIFDYKNRLIQENLSLSVFQNLIISTNL